MQLPCACKRVQVRGRTCQQDVIACLNVVHAANMQDPDGAYISRWVPELAALPKKWLHQPWLAPADVLARAGVEISSGPGCYPPRITTADLRVCSRGLARSFHAQCCQHLHAHAAEPTYSGRLCVACWVQELRAENARRIAAARSKAPELIDEAGYDLITVPQGATVKHDGSKFRVFTKSDYRKLVLTQVPEPQAAMSC